MDSKRKRWAKDTLSLGILMTALLTARGSLADHYQVPSGSMEPTLQVGDRIVVDKRAYGFRIPMTSFYVGGSNGPERGDVAILSSPGDGTTLVKRVVAVPGDVVRVQAGRLSINGQSMTGRRDGQYWIEDLGDRSHFMQPGGPSFGPLTLAKDEFLVMGDNRGNSMDGRSFGLVSANAFMGRAVSVYFRHGSFDWVSL